jgi:hypothetical protein
MLRPNSRLKKYLWSLTNEELDGIFSEMMHHMVMRAATKVPLSTLVNEAQSNPDGIANYIYEKLPDEILMIQEALRRWQKKPQN